MGRFLDLGLFIIASGLLLLGSIWGLWIAPPEAMMGDVYRIMFVHVPSAWAAPMAYTTCLVASVIYLFSGKSGADHVAAASAEVGLVFNALLLITGSLWGRPTWGVWWTWDPRLTTAAIMFFAYAGYLALRGAIDDDRRRSTWCAVVGIIIYADIPIVWFSVKMWNSLHQLQSSPKTMDPAMVTPLRIGAFAFLFAFLWLVRRRVVALRLRAQNDILMMNEGDPR